MLTLQQTGLLYFTLYKAGQADQYADCAAPRSSACNTLTNSMQACEPTQNMQACNLLGWDACRGLAPSARGGSHSCFADCLSTLPASKMVTFPHRAAECPHIKISFW